jgi:hypothetical protein
MQAFEDVVNDNIKAFEDVVNDNIKAFALLYGYP